MVKAITILFVLMATSFVQAQVLSVRVTEKDCNQNSCRKFYAYGSCTYIGNTDSNSVYLTAAHVVRNAEKIEIGYGGKWWGAIVAHKQDDKEFDFATIETRKLPTNKCFSLADSYPSDGARAVAYGYSEGQYNLRGVPTRIRIRSNLKGVYATMKHGDSGGPVLVDGKVVGVISGTLNDDGMTVCTDTVTIKKELRRRYGVIPCCNCRPVVRVQPTQPIQPKPDPVFIDNSDQIAALEGQITKLRADIDKLNNTQIPVWILDESGEPVEQVTYPLGSPIKLRFKAVQKK